MSKAQKELESVFGTIPTAEALENRFLILGDGSSSSPNLRASEMLLTAIFVSRYPGVVITNFYHGAPFGESVAKLGSWPKAIDFELCRGLLEPHYKRYFGDPQTRIDNIISRMKARGKSAESINERVKAYMGTLPVSLFRIEGETMMDRETFTSYIKRQRIYTTESIIDILDLKRLGSFKVEIAANGYGSITPNDAIRNVESSFLSNYPVMKICCPECSLSNEGANVEHGVSMNGDIFQSVEGVGQKGNTVKGCRYIKTLKENLVTMGIESILDVPVKNLINIGFKPSGKLIFLLEALLFKNPNIAQALRAYSKPNGTIAKAAETFEGLTMLTPSIYIKIEEEGQERDASIYELLDYIKDPKGLNLLTEFTQSIPLADDGIKRTLNISTGTIKIN